MKADLDLTLSVSLQAGVSKGIQSVQRGIKVSGRKSDNANDLKAAQLGSIYKENAKPFTFYVTPFIDSGDFFSVMF